MPETGADVDIVRVYDDVAPGRTRVLVDRLWPRGVSKDAARLDMWLKDVAPSTGLRRWYGHDPEKFTEFRDRYEDELAHPPAAEALRHLRDLAREGPLTLVTATRETDLSHATVLAGLLST